MKAFRFTLEAVRTIRQRQENEAAEFYARALRGRQNALEALDAIHHLIVNDFKRMRQLLAGGCAAAQAAQAQNYHRSLEKMRQDAAVAVEQAECRVNAASQAMLTARQQREIVDVYCEKQHAAYLRAELREEQKAMDEFASRRVGGLHAIQTHASHE
jgi:flagellar export protein FliJ